MDKSSWRLVWVLGLIIIIFAVAKVVVALIGKPEAIPTDIFLLPGPTSTPGGPWVTPQSELSDFNCGPDGEVISGLVILEISGGVPPYFVQFNSDNTVLQIQGVGMGFWLPGGTGATARVYDSQEGERNESTIEIYVPTHHSQCEEQAPTDTVTATTTLTATHISTATSTPSPVSFIFWTSTPTRDTNNPPAHTLISTPTSQTTFPPLPTSTNSLPPTFTNTPPPTATNPPPPTPTNTPPPTATNPPPPTLTNTPIPNRPQCDDGIDNDGDTKVDKDDPQCHNKHDTDESQ